MSTSPIEMVKGLWGGELREIDTIDAANELVGELVMGLWNRPTRHQDRGAPFRLTRTDIPETREGLARCPHRPRRDRRLRRRAVGEG